MPKTCNFESCNFNQFGGGYCPRHQWCRTDKKPKPLSNKGSKPLRKSPVRKVSKKQQKRLGEQKLTAETDRLFYAQIWEDREHIDYETGRPIYGELLTLYFHHVLPKAIRRYKKYRHCSWNIVLLSWATHTQAETLLDKLPRVKAYQEWLIKNLDAIESGELIPEDPIYEFQLKRA